MGTKSPRNRDSFTATLLPFDEPLSKEGLMKKAESELNETEETREICLEQLKTLINDHNVRCITTDDFLLRFLRTRKFQVQRSFESLRNYCKERVSVQHIVSKLQPETMELLLRNKVFGILPYRDYDGRLIIYVKEGNWKESICTVEEASIYGFVVICYATDDESSQINGIRVLLEESSFSFRKALLAIQHLYIRKDFLFKGVPLRYQRVDVTNEPFPFSIILALVRPFLPEKVKNRIILHGKSRDELFQQIPQCLLPTESKNSMEDPFINQKLIEILKVYMHKVKEEQRYFLE